MPLSLRDVTRLTRALVDEHYADRVSVEGVARAESGSDYAEVLLTVRPAPTEDRRGTRTLLVQVRRVDADTVQGDVRRRLTRALRPRPLAQ